MRIPSSAEIGREPLPESEQMTDVFLIIHGDVQIPARNADVAVPCSISHFGKRSLTSQGVADKCVAAMPPRDSRRAEPQQSR